MRSSLLRPQALAVALLTLLASASCSTTSEPSKSEPPASTPPPATPLPGLGMNDVSVLVPLPKSPKTPGYLKPEDAGARGALLTKAAYDKIPTFPHEGTDTLDYARLRAVAIRFDGCFPAPTGCQAQIRLVMQPIADDGEGLDSAVHLFYRLTEAELAEVVTGLRQLRLLAPEVQDSPLDVHAALAAQGMDGAYGAALRELVLKYAGEESFSRMTFFLRAPPIVETWFLGGFDRVNGALQPIDILGVGKTNQRVIRNTTTEGYDYEFLPVESKPEDTALLLTSAKAKAASPDDVKKTLAAFLRIQNPKKYGPDQLQCAGCHVSTHVVEQTKLAFGIDTKAMPDAFTSTRDLTTRGESAKTPTSLRAFGWFVKTPMISTRVVNETAGVVEDLEKRFPATPPTR